MNSFFCSAERILRNLSALHFRTHGGLYAQLQVEPAAGLPSPLEWVRVRDDARLAATALDAETTPVEHAHKADYFTRLRALGPDPIEALKVELRYHDRENGVHHVRVIVDTVEVTGLIVRWTVEMAETAQSVDSQQLLIRNGQDLFVSPDLGNRLSMMSTASAESAFLELTAHPGVTVQRVSKATVGPFCLAELPGVLPFGPLLTDARGAFATFALDVAARDIVRDGNNDPLTHRLMENLATNADALAEGERSRLRLGYRVYRDRKFVTDHATQAAIEELCRSAATRNIIYIAAINNSTPAEQGSGRAAALPSQKSSLGPSGTLAQTLGVGALG